MEVWLEFLELDFCEPPYIRLQKYFFVSYGKIRKRNNIAFNILGTSRCPI